jgi:hypothetical protein
MAPRFIKEYIGSSFNILFYAMKFSKKNVVFVDQIGYTKRGKD